MSFSLRGTPTMLLTWARRTRWRQSSHRLVPLSPSIAQPRFTVSTSFSSKPFALLPYHVPSSFSNRERFSRGGTPQRGYVDSFRTPMTGGNKDHGRGRLVGGGSSDDYWRMWSNCRIGMTAYCGAPLVLYPKMELSPFSPVDY